MNATLVLEDRPRVSSVGIRPRPVGYPTHDGDSAAERTSLQYLLWFGNLRQAIRGGQENQAAVAKQGVGAETGFSQVSRQLRQAGGARQHDYLLPNFESGNYKLEDFTRRLIFSNHQTTCTF